MSSSNSRNKSDKFVSYGPAEGTVRFGCRLRIFCDTFPRIINDKITRELSCVIMLNRSACVCNKFSRFIFVRTIRYLFSIFEGLSARCDFNFLSHVLSFVLREIILQKLPQYDFSRITTSTSDQPIRIRNNRDSFVNGNNSIHFYGRSTPF